MSTGQKNFDRKGSRGFANRQQVQGRRIDAEKRQSAWKVKLQNNKLQCQTESPSGRANQRAGQATKDLVDLEVLFVEGDRADALVVCAALKLWLQIIQAEKALTLFVKLTLGYEPETFRFGTKVVVSFRDGAVVARREHYRRELAAHTALEITTKTRKLRQTLKHFNHYPVARVQGIDVHDRKASINTRHVEVSENNGRACIENASGYLTRRRTRARLQCLLRTTSATCKAPLNELTELHLELFDSFRALSVCLRHFNSHAERHNVHSHWRGGSIYLCAWLDHFKSNYFRALIRIAPGLAAGRSMTL
jgi:hypothetical protein